MVDPAKKHGFIDSQKMGIEVFRGIDPEAPLIVAEAVCRLRAARPGRATRPAFVAG